MSCQPTHIPNDVMDAMERFVVLLYSRACPLKLKCMSVCTMCVFYV